MPKMKTHSGTKKRVKRTGSGKFVVQRSRRNHLLQQKSKRQKRLNSALVPAGVKVRKTLAKLLPYS